MRRRIDVDFVPVLCAKRGMAKIGISKNPAKREYQLRWGERPLYVTWPTHKGSIVRLHECADQAEARSMEKYFCDELWEFEARPSKIKSGGRPEWFCVQREQAVKMFEATSRSSGYSVMLPVSLIRKVENLRRTGQIEAPSVDAYLRWSALERSGNILRERENA